MLESCGFFFEVKLLKDSCFLFCMACEFEGLMNVFQNSAYMVFDLGLEFMLMSWLIYRGGLIMGSKMICLVFMIKNICLFGIYVSISNDTSKKIFEF